MKKILKSGLMLVFATSVFVAGCEKNETIKSTNSGDSTFTFAAIGHSWIMSYENSMPKAYDNDTLVIVSSQGTDTWVMDDGSIIYCTPNEFGMEKEGNIFTVCKADARVNDIYSGIAGDCKVVAIDLPVTVSAGTFNCFKVERSINGEYRETYYVNKQYGLVKDENEEYVCFLLSKNF